jgi:phosphate-selective porin OprO/OprP
VPVLPAGRDDTFVLESLSGQALLRLGINLQVDARATPGGARERPVGLRRLRPVVSGAVRRGVQFRFMPDFAGDRAEVFDAYVDLGGTAARLLAGKFKTPFGLERLQNATNLAFLERGLSDSLVPNRDVGLQVHGEPLGRRLRYAVALLNGAPSGGSASIEADRAKDLAAHLFAHPWLGEHGRLGLGAAVTRGERQGTGNAPQLAAYRTPAREAYFQYAKGVWLQGTLRRGTLHGYLFFRRLGVLAEGVQIEEHVAGETLAPTRLVHRGWQVQGTVQLTDDEARFDGAIPRRPLHEGGPGALALSGRIDGVTMDARSLAGAAAEGASLRLRSYTYGLTWVPDGHFRAQIEHVLLLRRGAGSVEHAIQARLGARF